MGSPITFSGFNNIDFSAVLNLIMQQERVPLNAIDTQRTTLKAQSSAFATLATRLGSLETGASSLAGSTSFTKVAATSSDDAAVGISAGTASVTGRYELVVSALAKAQVTASQTTYSRLDEVVATAGTISFGRLNQPPIDVPIQGSMTVQDIADAINQAANSPVNASVVQVAAGQYRMVLTSRAPGVANAFTVSFPTPLSGGSGLAFTDTDGNGVAGDTAADNLQASADAQLTVNAVPVTSTSNVLTDVIPGVTVTLKKSDPTTTVVVDVAKDSSAIVSQVKDFATAYNSLIDFFGDQNSAAANGKASIGRDPLVRSLRESLRSAMMGVQGASGTFARLAEVGVGFDKNGHVTIDETLLKNTVEQNPTDVATLFSDRFGAIDALVQRYTDSGGLVAGVQTRIDTQVANLGKRIDAMEAQLSLRRDALQQQFIAADRAMSQLNSQGNSLSSLANQYRLF